MRKYITEKELDTVPDFYRSVAGNPKAGRLGTRDIYENFLILRDIRDYEFVLEPAASPIVESEYIIEDTHQITTGDVFLEIFTKQQNADTGEVVLQPANSMGSIYSLNNFVSNNTFKVVLTRIDDTETHDINVNLRIFLYQLLSK